MRLLCRAHIASFLDESSTSRLLVYQDGKDLGAVGLLSLWVVCHQSLGLNSCCPTRL